MYATNTTENENFKMKFWLQVFKRTFQATLSCYCPDF